MKKTKWLSRRLIDNPFCFCLCLNESDYNREVKRLNISRPNPFITHNTDATTHIFTHDKGKHCAIICMNPPKKDQDFVQIYALLVHEAVHIWQESCAILGENKPSIEFEAYSIQSITQELIQSFNEQCNIKIKQLKQGE